MRAVVAVAFLGALLVVGINASYYMPLSYQACTSGGCTTTAAYLAIDSQSASSSSQSSYNNLGLASDGTTVTLSKTVRAYMVNGAQTGYQSWDMRNQEISYTVNTAGITCGGNGALYFTSMPTTGTAYQSGGSYCDANSGPCNEFDVWEANTDATAMTAHPCSGGCDTNGCQVNPYKNGQTSLYGPGSSYQINTANPFTVVTQFVTSTGTSSGTLTQVKRYYIQGSVTTTPYSIGTISGSTVSCSGEGNGGFSQMSTAFANGMVMIFSLWSSNNGGMSWLDVTPNGACPNNGAENFQGGSVSFGNIKIGPIGTTTGSSSTGSTTTTTTTKAPTTSGSTTTTTTTKAPTTTTTTTTTVSAGALQVYSNGVYYNSFSDYSWGTYNDQATAVVYTGQSKSFSLSSTSYDAIYFHTSLTTINANTYAYIKLLIFSTVTFPANSNGLVFLIYGSSGSPIGVTVNVPIAISAGSWTAVTVSTSSFGASTSQITGIAIQLNTANTGETIYVTGVQLTH